jgi:hypothetical protein
MNLLRPRNCPHLLAVSSSEYSTGVGAGFTGDPRNRPCGPGSPKGFGSYRGPARIYGHLRALATIPGEKCGLRIRGQGLGMDGRYGVMKQNSVFMLPAIPESSHRVAE